MTGLLRSGRLASLVLLAACGGAGEPPIENVLLVSFDTTRADHVSGYGEIRGTTPNIDRLAERGVLFEHAVSSNPQTLPSHSTMLTGTRPLTHGVRDNDTYRLSDADVTLAEILRERGFATGAVVGARVLEAEYGLAQGFDHYDDDFEMPRRMTRLIAYVERKADEVARHALDFLEDRGDEPFFLFVHFFDPHYDWKAPPRFAARFPEEPYAAEIAFADAQLGRILEELERRGLDDTTLVVVTADHGESFGAHGEPTHAFFAYEVTQRVPLVIRAPGGRSGHRVEQVVGVIDVVPTVLGLLGIEIPETVEGRDLSTLVRGEAEALPGDAIYSESLFPTRLRCNPLFALTEERWKYILTREPELYDLESDPGEERNLVEEAPEVAARLRGRLESLLASSRERPSDERTLDRERGEMLAALGYLVGPIEDAPVIDPELDDPKDCVRFYVAFGALIQHMKREDYARAREFARQVTRERPQMPLAYRYLSRIAQAEGEWEEVVSHLRLYLALHEAADGTGSAAPFAEEGGFIAGAHTDLGAAYAELGRYDEAARAFQESLRLDAEQAAPHYNLGLIALERGRPTEAERHFEAALRVDPDHRGASEELAQLR